MTDQPNGIWDEAEKFHRLEYALRTIAERSIEWGVEAFHLIPSDQMDLILAKRSKYTGALPMIIEKKQYLCMFRLKLSKEKDEPETPSQV